MNRARVLVLVLLAPALLFAQSAMTIAQLVSFIKSSIQQHNPDKDVAESVAKLKITNKLDGETVDELQMAGAGPRTVAALKKLSASSAAENGGARSASALGH
jgi:phosphotransferase system HPr-like phosphotransfer protein